MKTMHKFRFADDDLNHKLILLLKKKAEGKCTIDENGVVHYSHDDEDLIGNDLISAIRFDAFPSWQIISFPPEWAKSYESYMTEREIPFRAEMRDGKLRFLIPRNYLPAQWKLEEPS